ncbi:CDP-alcohol phosphatidyltransferase family protein [Paracoccus sp. NGMCC 1.201697]|uniref:CDP-alcohol phosphatidyltransferase family protein n=1 Tax=Paracoccus broussonetiae subsp. drimophilus TaxID=3373869 RepID=A0ABW7LHI1_9RHOB
MEQLGHSLSAGIARLAPGARSGQPQGHNLRGLAGAGLGGVVVIVLSSVLLGAGWMLLPALVGYAVLLAFIRRYLARFYPHPRFGACNAVTLWRAALVLSLLGALLAGQLAGLVLAALATVSLLLDGVDGWLARRSGLVSEFGARFDMEVDAAFGLVLSLHALAGGAPGPEVLLLGLPRYAFLLGGLLWPWMRPELPQRFRRKAICVTQLAVLILLQLPALPREMADLAAWLAIALLLWSFALDMVWLWRHRS